MKKVSFRKNNRGLTLVELIVVVAVLGILATAGISTISQITAGRARKFTNELVALMAECKVDAISGAKRISYLEISRVGDDIYGRLYEGGDDDDPGRMVKEDLLGTNVSCSVNNTVIADGKKVCIGFKRSTGSLRPMSYFAGFENNVVTSGELTEIEIGGGFYTYTITVHPATGYYSVT